MSAAAVRRGDARRTLAPFGRRLADVVHNAAVGAYRVITLLDELGGHAPPRPGQFYMLAAQKQWGGGAGERPFLARAFSVLRARPGIEATLELDFLLEDVGPGTARLCDAAAGDRLWLTGPLGRGFEAPAAGAAAVLVGGGVGIAPLAIWQDELTSRSTEVVALLGFRDAEHAAAEALLSDVAVATDDGSVGHHGLVTELLDTILERGPTIAAATVYACGPPPMLEAVRARCDAAGAAAQLALEAPMACGYGACYGCVVATRDGYKRVCLDGPVFDATELASVTGESDGQ
jgi:NAD(P)H-flavin reductase